MLLVKVCFCEGEPDACSSLPRFPPPTPLEEDAPPRKRRSDEDNEGDEKEDGENDDEGKTSMMWSCWMRRRRCWDPEEAAAAASKDVEEDEGVADVAGSKKPRFQCTARFLPVHWFLRKKRSLGFNLCKIKGNVAICLFCNGGPVRFKLRT